MSTEIDELKARLAAAGARKAATIVAVSEEDQLRAQVTAAELAAKNAEAIAAAEKAEGPRGKRIVVVDCEDYGVVIVKRPHPVAWRKWSELDPAKVTTDDFETLVRPCVIYPDVNGGALDKVLDDLPATIGRLAGAVTHLAGARKDEHAGK